MDEIQSNGMFSHVTLEVIALHWASDDATDADWRLRFTRELADLAQMLGSKLEKASYQLRASNGASIVLRLRGWDDEEVIVPGEWLVLWTRDGKLRRVEVMYDWDASPLFAATGRVITLHPQEPRLPLPPGS